MVILIRVEAQILKLVVADVTFYDIYIVLLSPLPPLRRSINLFNS